MAMTAFLIILAIRIVIVPFAASAESSDSVPTVLCEFYGVENTLTHNMSVPEIPKRCGAVLYASYFFDYDPSAENMNAIKCLQEAGFPVWITVVNRLQPPPWLEMMDTDKYDKELEGMIKYVNDNSISGIILVLSHFLYRENVTGVDCHLGALIDKLKGCGLSAKIGILINGCDFSYFGREELFNYTNANDMLDVYFVDMTGSVSLCKPELYFPEKGGLPIESTNDLTANIVNVFNGVASSAMDKNKRHVYFSIKLYAKSPEKEEEELEYPQYCELVNKNKTDPNTLYCGDPACMYYDRAKYAKTFFSGLSMGRLDFDYWNDACGCERYAITNALIDGWESK